MRSVQEDMWAGGRCREDAVRSGVIACSYREAESGSEKQIIKIYRDTEICPVVVHNREGIQGEFQVRKDFTEISTF